MKGRIIGREGRNIRALEAATGVSILIDDTPEAVVISCFDPVRKEVARQLMERLITDGRIHPTRIEELTKKIHKEVEVMYSPPVKPQCWKPEFKVFRRRSLNCWDA